MKNHNIEAKPIKLKTLIRECGYRRLFDENVVHQDRNVSIGVTPTRGRCHEEVHIEIRGPNGCYGSHYDFYLFGTMQNIGLERKGKYWENIIVILMTSHVSKRKFKITIDTKKYQHRANVETYMTAEEILL